MLALEVVLNGGKSLLAGFEDWDMLTAFLRAQRAGRTHVKNEFELNVHGLAQPQTDGVYEYVRWQSLQLAVGDELVLRLVDVSEADPPIKRYRSDKTVQENPFTDEELEEMERQNYRRLKKKFEGGQDG